MQWLSSLCNWISISTPCEGFFRAPTITTTTTINDSFKYLCFSSLALQWPSTHDCLPLLSGKTKNPQIRDLYCNFLQWTNCPWRRQTRLWLHNAVLWAAVMEQYGARVFLHLKEMWEVSGNYTWPAVWWSVFHQPISSLPSPTFPVLQEDGCCNHLHWVISFWWCPSVEHNGRDPVVRRKLDIFEFPVLLQCWQRTNSLMVLRLFPDLKIQAHYPTFKSYITVVSYFFPQSG